MNNDMVFQDLADGRYVAEIVGFDSDFNQNDGYWVEQWYLCVTEGEGYVGAMVAKRFHLTNEKAVGFLKKELRIVGIPATSHEEYQSRRKEAVGRKVRIEAVTNDQGWQSYYVHGLVAPAQTPIATESELVTAPVPSAW